MTTVTLKPESVTVQKSGGLATVKISSTADPLLQKGDVLEIANTTPGTVSKTSKVDNLYVTEIPMPMGGADALALSIQEKVSGDVLLTFSRKDG